MKFLLQTINNEIDFDMVFAVRQNIQYQRWRGVDANYKYAELEDVGNPEYRDYIPVGTVEFVTKFCRVHVNPHAAPTPLNVPPELMKYKKDTFYYPDYVPEEGCWFVKDSSCIKSAFNGFYTAKELCELPADCTYQISKKQNIESEFWCFINGGIMLDCRCYSGNFRLRPEFQCIQRMLEKYRRIDPYTLDVFIASDGHTQIMECHDFWSVGLYGFEHPSLCQMVSKGFFNLKKQLQ